MSENKIDYRLTMTILVKDVTKTIPQAPTTNKNVIIVVRCQNTLKMPTY